MTTTSQWISVSLLFVAATQVNSAHFERESFFSAVWINYGKCFDIIEKARGFAIKANGGTDEGTKSGNSDTLRLSDGIQSTTIEFALDYGPKNLDGRNMPPQATSIRYSFARPRDSAISKVEIEFGGWGGNVIRVQGADQTQVDAATSLLQNAIMPHTTFFGSTAFRLAIGIAFLLTVILFFRIAISPELHLKPSTRMLFLAGAIGVIAILLSGTFERALPGCSISDGQAWMDRNNALFTFGGFVLSIVVPFVQMLLVRAAPTHEMASSLPIVGDSDGVDAITGSKQPARRLNRKKGSVQPPNDDAKPA